MNNQATTLETEMNFSAIFEVRVTILYWPAWEGAANNKNHHLDPGNDI